MKVLFVTIFIVIIDQVSKLLVKGFSIPFLNFNYEGMYKGERIPLIGDFLRLTFIENPGMAFGFHPGDAFKLWISVFSLVASIGIIIYLYFIRNQSLGLRFSLAFILGGAIGNLIDRMFYGIFYNYAPVFYGHVVDFIDVDFFDFAIFGRSYDRWPIFNVADAAVTIGVLLLLFFYKSSHEEKEEHEKALEETAHIEEPNVAGPVSNDGPDNGDEENVEESEELEEKKSGSNGQSDKGKDIPL